MPSASMMDRSSGLVGNLEMFVNFRGLQFGIKLDLKEGGCYGHMYINEDITFRKRHTRKLRRLENVPQY